MKMKVGLYIDPAVLIRNPGYLDALINNLDLNTVVFNSGYSLPNKIISSSPLPVKGNYYTCGISFTRNDEALRKALEICRERKLSPFISCDLWGGIANEYADIPGVSAQAFDGRPLTYHPPVKHAIEQKQIPCCPAGRDRNDWFTSAVVSIADSYDIDGIIINKTRYPDLSFYPGLTGCACRQCAAAAEKAGIDLKAVQNQYNGLIDNLSKITEKEISSFVEADFSPGDFIQIAGNFRTLLKWTEFRTARISESLQDIATQFRAECRQNRQLAAEILPPSHSFYSGQDYHSFEGIFDFLVPDISGVLQHRISAIAAIGNLIMENNTGLSEKYALQAVLAWFGIKMPSFPGHIKDIIPAAGGNPDIPDDLAKEFIAAELNKTVSLTREKNNIFPTVNGNDWNQNIIRFAVDAVRKKKFGSLFIQHGTDAIFDFRFNV